MKKVVMFNRKGGVGKTVCAINWAGCLDIKYRKRVLVVDCDAQINTTTCLTLQEGDDAENINNISMLFKNSNYNVEDILHPIHLLDRRDKKLIDTNITLAPGSRELDNVDTSDMYTLRRFLEKCDDMFDYCILDCPPALTNMTINALCAADYAIIPVFAGRDSVSGYGMVIEEIDAMKQNGYNENLIVLGVLINALDRRRALEKYYKDLWKDTVGDGVIFNTAIRDSSDVPNAYEFGKPIHYYKPSSDVAGDYNNAVKEMIARIKKTEGH